MGYQNNVISAPAYGFRSVARTVGLAVAALTLAGCGTTAVDGTPTTAGATQTAAVDIAQLDSGNYPTKPQPPLGAAGSDAKGARVEAARLADYVVGPWEADPRLTESDRRGAMIIKDAKAVVLVLHEKIAAAAGEHGFITGFGTQRANAAPNDTSLLNTVMVFPDPDAAAAAAADFSARALDPETIINDDPVSTSIPGHPEAPAVTYGANGWTTVQAITAHGPYVLLQRAETTLGIESGAALVAKTLDLQASAISGFTPTPPADLAKLPVDPSGLLARTLPDTSEHPAVVNNLVYGPHAALLFQSDPAATATLFKDTGTDLMSKAGANVYQAADGKGAQRIVDTFVAELKTAGFTAAEGVKGLADSACLQAGGQFWCMVVDDRYAIEADSNQLKDVHQKISAQYEILTSS